MRRRAISILALLTALLAGCGGGDEPQPPPSDFAIEVEHADGSLPPPHHAEWALAAALDGSGHLEYVPDYPGEGVPTYRADFEVDDAALEDLHARLSDLGLLEPDQAEGEEPAGGDVVSATVTADGETIEIPAYAEDGGAALDPVAEEIHALAPERIWSSFERQREGYAQKRYGETP